MDKWVLSKDMKIKELISKTEAELRADLLKLQAEAVSLSLKIRTNQLKNVHQLRIIKKDIARIMTLLSTK